jgi:hypothetical protein
MGGAMNYNMTENYSKCLEKGLQFQDFITDVLIKELGISLSTYNSKKFQYNKGENKQGFEIKFDDKFKITKNIYIEIAEKSNPNNYEYVKSGIYRNDNTWLYLIGNYECIYIFSKKHLQLMHNMNKYKLVQTTTSQGFLVPEQQCNKYSINKIIINK